MFSMALKIPAPDGFRRSGFNGAVMRVFFSAGEASGDAYAAALARELLRLSPEPLSIEGIGGLRFREIADGPIIDSARWGAIGIFQALKVAPFALASYYRAKIRIKTGEPGLLIPIDFGYANTRLALHAKNRGWKVLYFVPPGSWRKDRQGADLPNITDAIVTPFPWSAEILQKMGANAYWFGHPIKQLLEAAKHEPALAGLPSEPFVAVLPGSRTHEIEANLPLIAEAMGNFPAPLAFALAPGLDPDKMKAEWETLAPGRHDAFIQSQTARVLVHARCAVVCSGTATLEAAVSQCPMVVIYRLTQAMEREAKLLRVKRPKFVALPNILRDRTVVPELVFLEATSEAVRGWADKLFAETPERTAQLQEFAQLDDILGDSHAITKGAELAVSLLFPK